MTHATSDGQRSCPASSLKATPHGGTTVLTVLTTLPRLPSLGPAPVNNVKVDNSGMQPHLGVLSPPSKELATGCFSSQNHHRRRAMSPGRPCPESHFLIVFYLALALF